MADFAREIKRSVLIVDRSDESREVLRTVLARRGVQILEASGARAGLELCRRHHPEVVVLDLDSQAAGDETVQSEYQSQADNDSASLLMLGGLQTLLTGILAEILVRIYYQSGQSQQEHVRREWNRESEAG